MTAMTIQATKLASGSINLEANSEACRLSFLLPSAQEETSILVEPPVSIMEIAKAFRALCGADKYEEAAEMLTEDFHFSNPMWSKNKDQWLKDFPKLSKDPPIFEPFEEGSGVVTRRGKKKLGMMNVSIVETWEFTDDGKVKGITVARA